MLEIYRHPSELSVPEVPTTVPPQLLPYLVENINTDCSTFVKALAKSGIFS